LLAGHHRSFDTLCSAVKCQKLHFATRFLKIA
jgi:hypothetical protein